MDPVRNPYAPGAGQRPPELAGRDREVRQFEVVLERVAAGRPERSLVLSGLRGVGKTVLLNAMRSLALTRAWGTGKVEARPDRPIRLPIAQALHAASRELAPRHRDPDRVDEFLGVLKAFALQTSANERKGVRWRPPYDVPAARGRADSGDLETDLIELFTAAGELARDLGVGIAVFIDEMQDIPSEELAALCGACHEISQLGVPFVVVGAGLPHLPTALSASKSYAERLFRYVSVGRLDRAAADRALTLPAASEGVEYEPAALDALYEVTDGYPYFIQAFGKATWDVAPRSPITADDVKVATPEAEAELAVGFFGSRYERATPAERDYMRAMAELGAERGDGPVATGDVAALLGRKPQSLSPARDALIKKGLVYASERGHVAFTVPHFGAFLRSQPT
ncbi:AAA family ATPase [Thermasporomyces composti]|uniref:AAA ATPase-like protein n=1 Tax=Thermasporomyces composti TaxID=696763 RepID=A0A3D9V8R8_THECX|nr:AAA family ATPase [Thermasporomyces composti]REF36560.1 AAA ATPase-like protein [Thermasporomyces composti]